MPDKILSNLPHWPRKFPAFRQDVIQRVNEHLDLAFADNNDGSVPHIQKTVFIKAPKNLDYGSVARVLDAVKMAGASPVSLQIDNLE